jgi:hypothetical protein
VSRHLILQCDATIIKNILSQIPGGTQNQGQFNRDKRFFSRSNRHAFNLHKNHLKFMKSTHCKIKFTSKLKTCPIFLLFQFFSLLDLIINSSCFNLFIFHFENLTNQNKQTKIATRDWGDNAASVAGSAI